LSAEAGAQELPARFTWPIRVYWEDTDGQGVVYYANYLKFMERCRTEWLRSVGVDQVRMRAELGLIFVIVSLEADYKSPARLDDELTVTCQLEAHGRTSFTFRQEILRGGHGRGNSGELLVSGRTRAACLDAETMKPKAFPSALVKELEQ
jgi:acyl-CoA thioester hydrolase